MRSAFCLLLFALSGCTNLTPAGVALAGVEMASVTVFGRGVGDIGVSAITGKDCSVVRLERGQTYCAPDLPAPSNGPFCSRSLGVVDCWSNPEAFRNRPREAGDTPPPTPLQDEYRRARWPKSLTVGL